MRASIKNLPISTQTAIIITIALVGMAVIFAVYNALAQRQVAYDLKLRQAQALATHVAVSLGSPLYNQHMTLIEERLLGTTEFADLQQVRVMANDGRVLSDVRRDEEGSLYPTFEYSIQALPENNQVHCFHDSLLQCWAPINYAAKQYGWIAIYSSLQHIEQQVSTIWKNMIIQTVATLLFVLVVVYPFFRRKTRSIEEAASFASKLPNNMGTTLSVDRSTPELKILSESLNQASRLLDEQHRQLANSHGELELQVKQRTNELEQAKMLAEQESMAKTRFLSNMSHELRTPLNAVLGYVQLLQIDKDNPLNKRQQEYLSEVIMAGNHLLELITDVLDLSSIEQGKIKMMLEDVDVGKLIQQSIDIVQPMANDNAVEIIHKDTPGVFACADKTRLKQAVLNLLTNAIKYNKTEGEIKIDYYNNDMGKVEITVRDTGLGIAADNITSMFEPFERLSHNRYIEGAGVGLAVTKNLVELMGGEITVSSTLGEGSQFKLIIPGASTTSATNEKYI